MRQFFRRLVFPAVLTCAMLAPTAFGAPMGVIRASDAAAVCGLSPVLRSGGVEFARGRSRLRLTPRKLPIEYGGIKIYMCYPAMVRKGTLYLSRLDLYKTLLPLSARKSGVIRRHVRTVTIDCGHGGRDRGAAGRRSVEKELTLKLGRRVAEILRVCGYRVHLTRDRDRYVTLPERCRLQRAAKSDLFVSIHVNAAADRSLSGIETFVLTPAGAASSSGGKVLHTSFRGNELDANNLLLGCSLQRSLLRRTGAGDRGVKRARFAVLKDISAPGALVEVGFISNPREERLLNDPAYRERIARGIAEGIVYYHRGVLR